MSESIDTLNNEGWIVVKKKKPHGIYKTSKLWAPRCSEWTRDEMLKYYCDKTGEDPKSDDELEDFFIRERLLCDLCVAGCNPRYKKVIQHFNDMALCGDCFSKERRKITKYI